MSTDLSTVSVEVLPGGQTKSTQTHPAVIPIHTLPMLRAMKAGWNLMSQNLPMPTQRFSWTLAAAETLATERNLRLLAVLRHGEPCAVAPMLLQKRFCTQQLTLLSACEVCEPMDLVYSDSAALEELAVNLVHSKYPVFLERVPADSPAIGILRRCADGHALVIQRPAPPCPKISLDESWTNPAQKLNGRRRGDLNRARRRAEEFGPLVTEILSPSPQRVDELLDEVFGIEASGWKGKARTALVYDTRRSAFFRAFAQAASAEGILRICFLTIGGRHIAMQLAAQCGGAFWLLKIGHNDDYARCSPGLLLIEATIRHAVQQKLASYEFLGMVSPWTHAWTQEIRPCVSLRIFPKSLRGMAGLFGEAGSKLLHHWRSR